MRNPLVVCTNGNRRRTVTPPARSDAGSIRTARQANNGTRPAPGAPPWHVQSIRTARQANNGTGEQCRRDEQHRRADEQNLIPDKAPRT